MPKQIKDCHQSQNLQCSSKFGAEVTLVPWKKPGQPKISNFGLKFIIHKNVTGFYVSMYNTGMEFFMEICEPASHAKDYIETLPPIQGPLSVTCGISSQGCFQAKADTSERLNYHISLQAGQFNMSIGMQDFLRPSATTGNLHLQFNLALKMKKFLKC